MHRRFLICAFTLCVMLRANPSTGPLLNDAPEPVKTFSTAWHDDVRDRAVPVKIYYPATRAAAVSPVILFSHGLGGSRDGYGYLGEHWAAHGYVSVHLQHLGSDTAVWKDAKRPMKALRAAAVDPSNARSRPRDVSFALDRLTTLNADPDSPLSGRLDLTRIGLAGHSFGAFTTLATVTPGHPLGGYDARIKAAIAMSAPAPRLPDAYARIRIPVYHLTGTEDTDMAGGASRAVDRRIPYDQAAAPACLLVFDGGDHMVFSGPTARKRPDARDLRFIPLVERSTLAFWDAHLKEDPRARRWLHDGDFAALLGNDGVFEQKGFAAP